eukprot:749414-Amphidinium_carterae.1
MAANAAASRLASMSSADCGGGPGNAGTPGYKSPTHCLYLKPRQAQTCIALLPISSHCKIFNNFSNFLLLFRGFLPHL